MKTILHTCVLAALLGLGGCRATTVLLEKPVTTDDGLGLRLDVTGNVMAVTFDDKELPGQIGSFVLPSVLTQGGLYVRRTDDALEFRKQFVGSVTLDDSGNAHLTGSADWLELKSTIENRGDYLLVSGSLRRPASRTDPMTLGLCLPINAAGWQYGQSILASETIKPLRRYYNWIGPEQAGGEASINAGLFTPIFTDAHGLALGVPADQARTFRVHYKDTEGFTIESDLDWTTAEGEQRSAFAFVLFRFDAEHSRQPYRAALAKFYRIAGPLDERWFAMMGVRQSGRYDWDQRPSLAQLALAQQLGGHNPTRRPQALLDVSGQTDAEKQQRLIHGLAMSLLYSQAPHLTASYPNFEAVKMRAEPTHAMAAAGWEPQPHAVVAHPDLLMERYGGAGDERVFFAVHNRGEKDVAFEMAIDLKAIGIEPETVGVNATPPGVEAAENLPKLEATRTEGFLVLRTSVAGGCTTVLELNRNGGVEAGAELTMPVTPAEPVSEK